MKIHIALIPSYEPDQNLVELARKLREEGFTVIVVDDGSGTNFKNIFESVSRFATVLTHEHNRGKGQALKTGLEYIRNGFASGTVIVTLDSDGQHTVRDAKRLCMKASGNPGRLWLGSRSFNRKVPLRSRFGNKITRIVYRLSTGSRVSDTQTGLRAFTAEMIPFMLTVPGERYEYEMNVLLECSRRKIPIREIGIETIYIDNNSASHFNTLKDSCRIYHEIIRFAASSFTGFVVDYSLYSLLMILTAGLGTALSIPLSNVVARIASASVNYSSTDVMSSTTRAV